MPRSPRLELPGVPLHITQRGVNRAAIFLDDDDRGHFRHLLYETFRQLEIQLHAYVLMDNHFHLLLTSNASGNLARAMRAIGQNHVQALNIRHGRSGSLWQGRFKSCLVESSGYFLTVMRYIELNPVRAAMVRTAQEHRWSSVHANLGHNRDPLITPHPLYLALGGDRNSRWAAYARWLHQGTSDEDLERIRQYISQERALGDERFQRMVEKTLNRPATCRPRGRPRKTVGSEPPACASVPFSPSA